MSKTLYHIQFQGEDGTWMFLNSMKELDAPLASESLEEAIEFAEVATSWLQALLRIIEVRQTVVHETNCIPDEQSSGCTSNHKAR